MKAIYRTPFFRTEVAASYLKESSKDAIYCMIGREDNPRGVRYNDTIFNTGDGAWPGLDTDPPEPLNSVDHDRELWDFAIAAKRLSSTDVTFALNRYLDLDGDEGSRLWIDHQADNNTRFLPASRLYSPVQTSTTNGDWIEENNCILINDNREVFLCVDRGKNPTANWEDYHVLSIGDDVTEYMKVPSLMNHKSESDYSTGLYDDNEYYKDGYRSLIKINMTPGQDNGQNYYVWKYICTIDHHMYNNFVSPQSNWIPINYYDVLGETDPAKNHTAETQDAKNDGYAPFILGLRYLIFRAFMPSSNEPGHGLPYNLNFRQTWFVKNPEDTNGNIANFTFGYMPNSISEMSPVLDSRYGDANHGQAGISTFTKYSGDIIYVEHRPSIYRQEDQTEEVFAIFSY